MEKGALSTMMALKPCWLMSPLSVSQILPMVRDIFDVIIFDEASQVRVEDAIPSIYRARTMVVVGDPKQMPPTNFFLGGSIEDDVDDDEVEEEVAESILDLASRIYSTAMLEWHYRSRAESLIAFSNRAFYGASVIAPPKPAELGADGAMRFTSVKEGYFTQKTGNPAEAERVVDEVRRILTAESPPSLGVIAMGQPQKLALDAALESRMEGDSAFAAAVKAAESRKEGDAHVGLFIKNLENVQGDERDVILMSVGYAPSRPGKKLYLNFGLCRKRAARGASTSPSRVRASPSLSSAHSIRTTSRPTRRHSWPIRTRRALDAT
jgi:superfamily I DNA and/or RNA helicase